MARILIRRSDNMRPNHAQPAFADRIGDPVWIADDGHEWGAKEGRPQFDHVDVPGLDAAKLRAYLEPETTWEYEPEGRYAAPVRNHKWRCDTTQLNARKRRALLLYGRVTLTPTELFDILINKRTRRSELRRGRRGA